MQIERTPAPRRRTPRRLLVLTGLVVAATVAAGTAFAATDGFGTSRVGQVTAQGSVLASNQHITALGRRILVDNGQLISSTLSPDGRHVAALTTGRGITLSILNTATGQVQQQVGTDPSADLVLPEGDVPPDGPLYSPDGRSLWFGQNAQVLRFPVALNGTVSTPTAIPIPNGFNRPAGLPSGMALSPDGQRLFVALNGQNSLGVINTATDKLVRTIAVDNAPRQVVVTGGLAFVSAEGGRPAHGEEYTNNSYETPLVASSVTGGAVSGTVSVVNLSTGEQVGSIPVGLQPTAMYLHGTTLFVTNSNDDSVSVIDTTTQKVVQTFNTNPLPGSTAHGHHPNGVTMPDASHVLVSLGRDNAVAVYGWSGATKPVSYQGLIPTDYYPTGVETDPTTHQIIVTNDRGVGARGPVATIDKGPLTQLATGKNTHNVTGSLTTFTMPSQSALAQLTHRVFLDNGWNRILAGQPPARPGVTAVPVPARLGEPSTIKHVFLIVKENRSYDQVLGDDPRGNGDERLAQFGERATPNLHRLARQFELYDNFYDVGTNSADGNNWLMQADANDYLETEFGQFTRSYPAEGDDALAYQRDGFLWNAAARAGRTVRDFGEYVAYMNAPDPSEGGPSWSDWYRDAQILEHKASGPLPVPLTKYPSYSDIPSLNAVTDHLFPKFNTGIPDQYRTDIFLRSFRRSEQTGKLADLTMMRMPDDHTSGLVTSNPYPIAQVADNDLAVGRIIDAVTHSRFWPHTAIFVLEDDTQDGVDHVDGHRGPLSIISPYAVRGGVDDHYYTQLNVISTIERILGLSPMNQKDRAAEPMTAAFTSTPDARPYDVVPNRVPLNYGLDASTRTLTVRARGEHPSTVRSRLADVPADQRANFRLWAAWSSQQRFSGPHALADYANPEQLNRLTWYVGHGWTRAYPGDARILAPDQVPGRYFVTDGDGDD